MMKNKSILLCMLFIIVMITACDNDEKKTVRTNAEPLLVYGRYYRDGDESKEYIEILSEDTIDFSHAGTDLLVLDFKQLRQTDFPDDTEEELNAYLTNLEELLQQPYTFEVTEGEGTTTVWVSSIDGEDLSAKLLYNKQEKILLWGKLEYLLIEEEN